MKIGTVVVPSDGAKTSRSATSTILGQRVNIIRTGDRVGTDQKWNRGHLLNIVENVAPKTKQIFFTLAAKYPALVSVQTKKDIIDTTSKGGGGGGGGEGEGRTSKVKKGGLKKRPAKK